MAKRINWAKEAPITDKYKLHAAFLYGCLDQVNGNADNLPLHPDLQREYHFGTSAVRAGWVRITDQRQALRHIDEVLRGLPYRRSIFAMAKAERRTEAGGV